MVGALVALAFLVLVYAVMFGKVRPGEAWGRRRPIGRGSDVSVLDADDAPWVAGIVAAVVIAADVISLAPDAEAANAAWTLIGVTSIALALGWKRLLAIPMFLIGITGVGLAVAELVAGGPCLPGDRFTAATLFAAIPGVVFVVTFVIGALPALARPTAFPHHLAAGVLALAAIVNLGIFAVGSGGVGLLEELQADQRWFLGVPLLVGLLTVIAAGVGLRPRFGADVLAVAMVFLLATFAIAPGNCGLSGGTLVTTILVTVILTVVVRAVAGFVRGASLGGGR